MKEVVRRNRYCNNDDGFAMLLGKRIIVMVYGVYWIAYVDKFIKNILIKCCVLISVAILRKPDKGNKYYNKPEKCTLINKDPTNNY